MSLPLTYPMWEEQQKLCHGRDGKHFKIRGRRYCYTQKWAIWQSAQWLIERLYEPCSLDIHEWGRIIKHPNKLTKPYDVDSEPINWGDLHVLDVQRLGGGFLVTIEEAAPRCANFCAYIQMWLQTWGWKHVEVRTEW